MALTFDPVNRLIIVPIAYGTELTCQNLLNEIRDWEDSPEGIAFGHVIEGSGKEELGGGVKVGITLKLLNWKVQFEDRAAPPWIVCQISGGNLVAVNGIGEFMSPVKPSAYVTVTLTASSSATLQELLDIQHSSFEGGVWIDVVGGTSGTDYPAGTRRQPVDNLADAKSIAISRNFDVLYIKKDFTFGATDNIDDYVIVGEDRQLSNITVTSGCSTQATQFKTCRLTGDLDGEITVYDSTINTLSGVRGCFSHCNLTGNIILEGTSSDMAIFLECYLATAYIGLVEFDMGGDGPHLVMRAYAGGLKIKNKSGNSKVAIDFIAGRIEIESSVTAGTFFLRGIGEISKNEGTGITINDNPLTCPATIWEEPLASHPTEGTAGFSVDLIRKINEGHWKIVGDQLIIYDDDDVTPLRTFNLSGEQTTPYSERTPA